MQKLSREDLLWICDDGAMDWRLKKWLRQIATSKHWAWFPLHPASKQPVLDECRMSQDMQQEALGHGVQAEVGKLTMKCQGAAMLQSADEHWFLNRQTNSNRVWRVNPREIRMNSNPTDSRIGLMACRHMFDTSTSPLVWYKFYQTK